MTLTYFCCNCGPLATLEVLGAFDLHGMICRQCGKPAIPQASGGSPAKQSEPAPNCMIKAPEPCFE